MRKFRITERIVDDRVANKVAADLEKVEDGIERLKRTIDGSNSEKVKKAMEKFYSSFNVFFDLVTDEIQV